MTFKKAFKNLSITEQSYSNLKFYRRLQTKGIHKYFGFGLKLINFVKHDVKENEMKSNIKAISFNFSNQFVSAIKAKIKSLADVLTNFDKNNETFLQEILFDKSTFQLFVLFFFSIYC